MRWFRRDPRPADPARVRDRDSERVVELVWLPLWQAQLVLHHLWEADIPTTLSETTPVPWRVGMHEPMARLYVMERRLPAARAALAEVVDVS